MTSITSRSKSSAFEIDYELFLSLKVVVDSFVSVPPNPSSWDSDLDYYGYEEIEWHLENSDGVVLDFPIPAETAKSIEQLIKDEAEKRNVDDYV